MSRVQSFHDQGPKVKSSRDQSLKSSIIKITKNSNVESSIISLPIFRKANHHHCVIFINLQSTIIERIESEKWKPYETNVSRVQRSQGSLKTNVSKNSILKRPVSRVQLSTYLRLESQIIKRPLYQEFNSQNDQHPKNSVSPKLTSQS